MALIGDMQYLTIGSKTYRIASSSLPIASASTLGGIKIGTGLTIDSTTGVLSATGTSVTIDNALSDSSTNPVQNKVIKTALDNKANTTNIPTKTSDLTNDSNFMSGMTILSYGSSTWNDFLTAYQANHVVYCRASSNSNPASGSQTRMAFMAYVSNATNPTNVEFQYYRSVSSHSASQQGDQVYIYKLTNANAWTVTVREASVKVTTGSSDGIDVNYSSGAVTIGHTNSVTAQSTQAVYPITYDAQGHITGSGTAVTIPTVPTKTSDLTNDSGFVTNTGQITIESNSYPITSRMVTRISGVEGIAVGYDDGTTEGGMVFLPDGIGMNAVKTAIEAQIPNNIVNTITTTAGAHTAISNQEGDISFNVPTTAAHVGALSTSGGTITGALTLNSTIDTPAFSTDENNYLKSKSWIQVGATSDPGGTYSGIWVNNNGLLYSRPWSDFLSDLRISTTATLSTSSWSNNTQTITVTGVTTSNTVIVTPAPASITAYGTAGVYCSAQNDNSLTFTCTSTPTTNLTVNILIIKTG